MLTTLAPTRRRGCRSAPAPPAPVGKKGVVGDLLFLVPTPPPILGCSCKSTAGSQHPPCWGGQEEHWGSQDPKFGGFIGDHRAVPWQDPFISLNPA